ncbi:MAG: hypothetical protein KME26_05205 [Oscillatoria princeps RMCB-10]|jgi:hypothetical protein|nr:hypothetical protein [Oscillatoria princeps RMCB-10]
MESPAQQVSGGSLSVRARSALATRVHRIMSGLYFHSLVSFGRSAGDV